MDGRHIKVLGRGSEVSLGNPGLVSTFVRELIDQLGMRLLGEPQVFDVEQDVRKLGVEPFEDEGGVTAVGVLSTSHVAIHTWPLRSSDPLREMFVLDVYSCRDFDPAVATNLLGRRLHTYGHVVTDLSRALRYNRSE